MGGWVRGVRVEVTGLPTLGVVERAGEIRGQLDLDLYRNEWVGGWVGGLSI